MTVHPPFLFATVLPAEEDQSYMKAGVLVHDVNTPTGVTRLIFLNHRNGARVVSGGSVERLTNDAEEQKAALMAAWEALGKLPDESIDWVVARVKADFKR